MRFTKDAAFLSSPSLIKLVGLIINKRQYIQGKHNVGCSSAATVNDSQGQNIENNNEMSVHLKKLILI